MVYLKAHLPLFERLLGRHRDSMKWLGPESETYPDSVNLGRIPSRGYHKQILKFVEFAIKIKWVHPMDEGELL